MCRNHCSTDPTTATTSVLDESMNEYNAPMSGAAEELLRLYRIDDDDLQRVRGAAERLLPQLPAIIDEFYVWLRQEPAFHRTFGDDEQRVQSVKSKQFEYWKEFLEANIDDDFVLRRREIGEIHARHGVPLGIYLASVASMRDAFDARLPDETDTTRSISNLVLLDTNVVVDTYAALTTEIISQQSEALLQMSTPVTAIWDSILMLPLVGIVDSKRARDIMSAMLEKVAEARARVIILDISGVAIIDTQVANHLIKITKATQLMGCLCIVSGVSPSVAQTVVELGIDVGSMHTTATLGDAFSAALERTGVSISTQK